MSDNVMSDADGHICDGSFFPLIVYFKIDRYSLLIKNNFPKYRNSFRAHKLQKIRIFR